MVAQAIVPFDPEAAVQSVKALAVVARELREHVFIKGQDYGEIPGTNDKPVLLLPGMEKLMRALGLRAEYIEREKIIDFDKPLFFFEYECRLYNIETGLLMSTAIGSANSMESKWAWRWVQAHQVPARLDIDQLERRGGRISEFAFAIDRAETSGKYGKPADYWQQFRDAIASGTATRIMKPTRNGQSEAWEIDMTLYRVPNPDVADQLNTICKIGQKRSLGSAIKGVANVSGMYTVDLEDMPEFNVQVAKPLPDDAVEGEYTEEPATTPPTNGKRDTQADRDRLGNGGSRRVGETPNGHNTHSNDLDARLTRQWNRDALKPLVIDLFENDFNYKAGIDNYANAEHDEYLLPADITLAEAVARVSFYRSRTGKAKMRVFEDESTREKFVGACSEVLENDQAIAEALDAVADYPVGSLTAWQGNKTTAWAAVLAAGGMYIEHVSVPEDANPILAALIRLICAYITDLNTEDAKSSDQVAFENI